MSQPPPLLLTPGPLTTDPRVRQAMLSDWGSRDEAFIALTAELRARLLAVANGAASHVAVPIQGSGTFVVEAAVASLIAPTDKLLVLINGAYGRRMVEIARRLGRPALALEVAEDQAIDPAQVAARLTADPAITHVALVHCETTTGLLNPLAPIAAAVSQTGRRLILDAMSSFGALPIDLATTPITAVLASSNKCLEGVPGLGFALVESSALAAARGVSPSLSLDLHDQWRGFEDNGQWRFTPPVQVVAALVEALRLLEQEGGPSARLDRYQTNLAILTAGFTALGYPLYLEPALQAPIIATFRPPRDRPFDFERFYDALAVRGFIIYPGKLTQAPSFRIGCIGHVAPADIERLVAAAAEIET
ncbi:MAG TPA: 2-aminoethylphosphonate--pyruvate transaminase [Caulobacteraceae bacterium]